MKHTYHPNTFGLLYGVTTKTACGKRRKTTELVKPMETDCPACQDTIIADLLTQQEMCNAVHELRRSGY